MAFLSPANTAEAEVQRPFVETSIARHFASRLAVTHEERGVTVISGPWGIGKTTAIDAFVQQHEFNAVVVKVDPGSSKRGATTIGVMQLVVEAIRRMSGETRRRPSLSNAYWTMRKMVFDAMVDQFGHNEQDWRYQQFTLIFDEAQYLSREAIEMLRYWNDGDRTATPFPVGLAFVGNNEFALGESPSGQSVISGAVRSRALFIEALEYADVSDTDLILFLNSRGIVDPGAVQAAVAYFKSPRQRRDFRAVERLISVFKRRAGDRPVSAEVVGSILNP